MSDKGFWRTLPGVITAIAGLIAAVGGILATMHSLGWLGTAPTPPSNGTPFSDADTRPAEVRRMPALDELTPQEWHSRAVELWNGTVFDPADLAVQYLTKSIIRDSNNPNVYADRGLAYLDMGDPRRALVDLDRALLLNPTDPKALTNRGVAYYRLGRHEEARLNWTNACNLGSVDGCLALKKTF